MASDPAETGNGAHSRGLRDFLSDISEGAEDGVPVTAMASSSGPYPSDAANPENLKETSSETPVDMTKKGVCVEGTRDVLVDTDIDPDALDLVKCDLKRIFVAFFLCCLSSMMSHVLRIPLSTAKVDMQRELGASTLELSHVDTAYLMSHAVGQVFSPLMSSKSHSVLFCCIYHFVIGVALTSSLIYDSVISFIVIYAIVGFFCGPIWAIMFLHLGQWLPKKYSFQLMTFWLTCSDIGSVAGTMMCIYVQSMINWKSSFVMSGILNLLVAALLFTCYDNCYTIVEDGESFIKPTDITLRNFNLIVEFAKNIRTPHPNINAFVEGCDQVESSRDVEIQLNPLGCDARKGFFGRRFNFSMMNTVANGKASNARSGATFSFLKFFRSGWERFFITICKAMFRYINTIGNVYYLAHHTLALLFLKLVRHCFIFWITFYLSTEYGYSVQSGSYVSLIFNVGSFLGNVIAAYVVNRFWDASPIRASAVWSGISCLMVAIFASLRNPSVIVASNLACLCSLTTMGAESLIITRGIKSICDSSELSEKEYLIVYGFALSVSTIGSVLQGFLVAYVVDLYGWISLFFIFILALLLAALLLAIPAKSESRTATKMAAKL